MYTVISVFGVPYVSYLIQVECIAQVQSPQSEDIKERCRTCKVILSIMLISLRDLEGLCFCNMSLPSVSVQRSKGQYH